MPRKRAPKGNGTIRKRADGRFEARAPVGIDPGTGKTKFSYHYASNEADAAKWLRKTTASIDTGSYVEPEKMKLHEWLSIWEAEYLGSVKPGTAKTYSENVRLHIVPHIGSVRLSELRPHHVQMLINCLHRGERGAAALSAKTCRNVCGTLSASLERAKKCGYLRDNPAHGVELPRPDAREIRPFTGAEIDAFLQGIKDTPSESLFFTALYTGARLSELLGFSWSRIDLVRGYITIDRQMLQKRGSGTQREFGAPKNDKPRKIKVASAVLDMLKATKKQQAASKLKAGGLWSNADNLVFTDELGNGIPHATIEHRYKRIVTTIGLPERRFHDLRHTFATESLRLGVPAKVVSESLGHGSVSFTLDVYTHVTKELQDDAADRLQLSIMERMHP